LWRISILDASNVSYKDIFKVHIPVKTRIYSETYVYNNNTVPSEDANETILMTLSTNTIRWIPSIYYLKTFNKQKLTTATIISPGRRLLLFTVFSLSGDIGQGIFSCGNKAKK
jgi:hypothetical protein